MTKHLARVLPVVLALTATAGFAEQHDILLVEGGFFPEITYLSPGDTVVFTNFTDAYENVVATDGSWSTSNIPPEGTETMSITAEMVLEFAYDEGGEAPKLGTMSFAVAPSE